MFLRHMRVRFGGACCSKEGRTQLTGVVEVALPVQRGLHQGKECDDGSKAQHRDTLPIDSVLNK